MTAVTVQVSFHGQATLALICNIGVLQGTDARRKGITGRLYQRTQGLFEVSNTQHHKGQHTACQPPTLQLMSSYTAVLSRRHTTPPNAINIKNHAVAIRCAGGCWHKSTTADCLQSRGVDD